MNPRKLVLLLAFPCLALTPGCMKKEESSLSIVGGGNVRDDANGPERTSTVGLSTCSATIIAPDLVLTAAHCYKNSVASGLVIFGLNFTDKRVATLAIIGSAVNGGYKDSHNDVAMLRLAEGLPAGYRPVRLLPPNLALAAGEKVRQAGYGSTNAPGSFGTLRAVDSLFRGVNSLGALQVSNGPSAACFGDSGGPLYVQRNGEWFIAGITSTATVDANDRCIGGNEYTSIALQYNFILEMARKLTGRADPLSDDFERPGPPPEAPAVQAPAPSPAVETAAVPA